MSTQIQTAHDWLDRVIAEQAIIQKSVFGSEAAIKMALEAYDHFTEDELEDAKSLCT